MKISKVDDQKVEPVLVTYTIRTIRGTESVRERVFGSEYAARVWLSDQKRYAGSRFRGVIKAKRIDEAEARSRERPGVKSRATPSEK